METEIKMTDEQIRDNIKEQEKIRDDILAVHKANMIYSNPRCCWVNCITELIEIIPHILERGNPDTYRCKTFPLFYINKFLWVQKNQWLEVALLHLGFKRNKRCKGLKYYGHLTDKFKKLVGKTVYGENWKGRPAIKVETLLRVQLTREQLLEALTE